MRYVRVKTDKGPSWGTVHGLEVTLLDGAPYSGGHPTQEIVPFDEARLLAPVTPTKIFALGLNYADHKAEAGTADVAGIPVFLEGPSTILAPGGDVVLPPERLDPHIEQEVELAVVIGRRARHVRAADWRDVVFGFTIADDISARTLQKSDRHVTRAKGFDTFKPIGPWIETDFDPNAANGIRARVNGVTVQESDTSHQITSVPQVIEFLSEFATLEPGDVILTGTPAGPTRIRPGDTVELEIEGIGTLVHGVVPADWE